MIKRGHRFLKSTTKHVWLIHSATTAAAAAIALMAANLLNLGESYWAPISTIIVMQSTLGASWDTSKQRFIGTVIGALTAGAFYESGLPLPLMLGVGIFLMGLLCSWLKLVLSAFRFAGVTYAIIILLPHAETAWRIGLHRFIEVSIGIAVALAVTAVAPDHPFKKTSAR